MATDPVDQEIVGTLVCADCDDGDGEQASYRIGLVRDGRHIVVICEIHGPFKAFELAESLHWHCSDPTCTHGTREHDDS